MKVRLKEGANGNFRVFVVCEVCHKLIKDYRFYKKDKLSIKDTGMILDTVKGRMQKADYQYCFHCGNKNFK